MCLTKPTKATLTRTLIFTILHFITAFAVAYTLMGEIFVATLDATIEPLINSLWYFILDSHFSKKKET